MNPRQACDLAVLADRLHLRRLGQEGADNRLVALGMEAEVAEGIGVTAFDDCIGLGRKLGHQVSLRGSERIRSMPAKGMRSQSGW